MVHGWCEQNIYVSVKINIEHSLASTEYGYSVLRTNIREVQVPGKMLCRSCNPRACRGNRSATRRERSKKAY